MENLKTHLIEIRDGLEEDLKNLEAEMDELDPNSKDYDELDREHLFINGQTMALNYVLALIGL